MLGHEPVAPLTIMVARAIGVMHMNDEGAGDEKIIGVHVQDPAYADITDINQLPDHVMREIERFFLDYMTLENKTVEVDEMEGREAALKAVRDSFALDRSEETTGCAAGAEHRVGRV